MSTEVLFVEDPKKVKSLTTGFTNPYAEVDTAQVQVAGEDVAHKVAVRVKDDAGQWSKTPFIMSSEYNLIHNTLARDVLSDVMSRSGLGWTHLKTMWDGRRYACHYVSQKPLFTVNSGALMEHPFLIGIAGRNTYDGSGLLAFEVFMCAMSCLNQFHDRNRIGFFAIRHEGQRKFDIQDALTNLSRGMENMMKLAPVLKEMRSVPLSSRAIIDARRETAIPTSKWGDVLERLDQEEGTMFGLLQSLTFVATHTLSGFNSFAVSESIMKHLVK